MMHHSPVPPQTRNTSVLHRIFRSLTVIAIIPCLFLTGIAVGQSSRKFDFGDAGTAAGYTAVSNTTSYSAPLGHGWTNTAGLTLRDRGVADALRRDFIFTNTVSGRVFRVSGLTPNGKYLMKVLCGDATYGDHQTTVAVIGAGALPTISPGTAQYLELSATVRADASGILDITFGSPVTNWVVNALTLDPTATDITPFITSSPFSEWDASVFATDPTVALLGTFDGSGAAGFTSTGLSRADYLALISSEVDFWKTKQNASGAIIDPYANSEIQYATPAFANAAAVLVARAGRGDLLEAAAKAMDWATLKLKNRQAASSHEDFYPTMLAHGLILLEPHVDSARAATWRANLTYNPYAIYRQAIGSMNWNVVSSCGEALFQLLGIRPADNSYVTESWAAQGRHFTSPYGLYMEGPMAYDHFPRIFWNDVLAQGYTNPFSGEVREAMDRAAITSLFMQSPWGELPSGGRSAHHQWNEAEQCLTYEIYAAKASAAGDTLMAAAYKRAAHLSLSSMRRWVRPSGELQIVKNWVDPANRHAYESYSYHSQYNLLPMAMLAGAYEYAAPTEAVVEGPAPSDTGGFVFQIDRTDTPNRPHKVFANAGGTYVEIETSGDSHYDASGLIRIHQKGVPPQLGPSDSLVSGSSYNSPNPPPVTTGVGVSWKDSGGAWRTLGEMTAQITAVTMTPVSQTPAQVVFNVTYTGSLPNATAVIEHYIVSPAGVNLTTTVPGYNGPLRYTWPVLSNDGKTKSSINVDSNVVSVSQGGPATIFTAQGAQGVSVGGTDYSNHNGWARIATAEYPTGGSITLLISKSSTPSGTSYWKGDVDEKWNTNAAGNTNWSADAAGIIDAAQTPGPNSDVVFAATGASNLAFTVLGDNYSVRSVDFAAPAAVGIGGTQDLSLGEGGLTLEAGAGSVAFGTSGNLILGADQTWTNHSLNTLEIDSTVSSVGGLRWLDLEGNGTFAIGKAVGASLHVRSGSTLRLGKQGFPVESTVTLLDNFDSYDNSSATKTDEVAGPVWQAVFSGTGNANIVDNGGGQVLQTSGGAAWRGNRTDLRTNWNAGVGIGKTETLFFRFKANSSGGAFDVMFGLSPEPSNIDQTNAWQDFAVMPFLTGAGDGSADFKMTDAGLPGDEIISNVHLDQWYNIWLVVDNASQTYSVYHSQGINNGNFGGTATNYRNGFTATALNAFGVMAAGGAGSSVVIDDLYLLEGVNTIYPVGSPGATVPTPTTLEVAGDVTLDPGTTLECDVSTGELHDKLVVAGQFNASGTLRVKLDPAQPVPVAGDTFDLFDSEGGTVSFDTLDLPMLESGLGWDSNSIATGVLTVITTPTDYTAWAADHPFPPGTSGPDQDADHDGIANAFEWLFGADPLAADPGALPKSLVRTLTIEEYPAAVAGKHYLTMTAAVDKDLTGMTLVPQANASLDSLNTPASAGLVADGPVTDQGNLQQRTWIYTVPLEDSPGGKGFMNLKLVIE